MVKVMHLKDFYNVHPDNSHFVHTRTFFLHEWICSILQITENEIFSVPIVQLCLQYANFRCNKFGAVHTTYNRRFVRIMKNRILNRITYNLMSRLNGNFEIENSYCALQVNFVIKLYEFRHRAVFY